MNKFQKAYFQAFIISVIICWSPFNALAYLAPFIVLFWCIIADKNSIVIRNLLVVIGAWIGWIVFSFLINQNFIFQNILLVSITYGTLLPILAIPARYLSNKTLLKRMMHTLLIFVALEATIGIIQAIYGFSKTKSFDMSNGDFVEGTIHLSLEAERTFSNVFFATNIAFSLIVLIPYFLVFKKRGISLFFLGILALVLASVMHTIIFLLVALAVSFVLYKPKLISLMKRKKGFVIMVIIIFIPILASSLLSQNIKSIQGLIQGLIQGQFPRAIMVKLVFTDLPKEYPHAPFIGVGPGQFTSRASLIGTGFYFGGPLNPKPLPILSPRISKVTNEYLMDLWIESTTKRSYGSTGQPYFSWLSVYSEFGGIGLLMTFAFLLWLLFRTKIRSKSQKERIFAFAFGGGALLLFLLGAQENYWEVPQAILIGSLMLKVLYSQIVYSTEKK